MRTTTKLITAFSKTLSLLLVFLFPLFVSSQTFHGFASNPTDGNPLIGPGPIAVAPPGSMQNGDLVVVYVHYRGSGVTLNVSAAANQIWNTATAPSGSSNQTFALFWCRFNGTWAGSPSFSVSAGTNALSAIMYVFRPTATSKVWIVNVGPTNGTVTNTAVSITGHNTTLPRTVTMGLWGTPSSNTWGAATAGWTKVANQFRNTSGQSHTSAYKILAAAGATGNVSQTQSSSQVTKTTIISWAEVDPVANDECINAIPLTSSTSCNTTAGTLTNATYNGDAVCGATNLDAWYSFTALTTNPTITTTLTSGSGQRRTELYDGVCGALTSLTCSGNSDNLAATGLIIGNTYYVRVYSNNTSPYNFNICVRDPSPANNLCGSSIALTSSTVCTPTSGNMYGATLTGITTSGPDCSGGTGTYDLWYHFIAQKTNPTITLSNLGATFAGDAHLQLFTNNCTNPLTPLFCGTNVINANFLTPNTTYKIRVYGNGTVPTTSIGNGFDICVTDPVSVPPSNDECSGAVNLSVNNGCTNLAGDMAGATLSSIPTACGSIAYDVWYRFAAVNANATITLSSFGTNFQATRGVEVFSTSDGTCGGTLVSLGCNATSLALTGLTAGNTYYVRVYSTTGPPPNGNARFNICVQSNLLPTVRYGNSYVNISKKTTGGVVEQGDTLEIRMTINYNSGTVMNNLRFVDNVPSHTTMLAGPGDSIRVITNEGLTFRRYTPGADTDAATYLASPPPGHYNIRMNLGFGGSNPGTPPDNSSTNITNTTGTMDNSSANRPRGNGLLFATAYRVVASGNVGDTIVLNPAQFIYRTGGSDVTLTAVPYKILISEPLSLCTNSIGLNNATESGGTFGTGTTLNRGNDLATPIPGYNFLNYVSAYNGLGDGQYAIVNNISPRSSTNRNAAYRREGATNPRAFDDPDNRNNRMHDGHWYIDGDHTGTYNAIGNIPPAEPTNSGYMLMVNADYVASEVFVQTLNNLCPDTYYEFSAWFRNICPTCGSDSLGQQFQGTPTAPTNGYPGVYPNLSFALNDLDYYSTGEIDTVGWLKKGFVFRTGPVQTSARFSIRNNSQGGGGNDWVMDDIAVATCLPTMSYSPTINPNVCQSNPITIADTISSFFENYTTYKWQRSTNGGLSWTDITGVTSLPDTNYYITTYTVPPAATTFSDSGDLYRVVVATTADNLVDPNCNISDGVTITLSVINCDPVLDIDLLYLNGRLTNEYAHLSWATTRESKPYTFTIEKSTDQVNFIPIGTVNSHNDPSRETNYYSFSDPQRVSGKVWYRVVMTDQRGAKKYSRIINLNNLDQEFGVGNIINPFDSKLYFEIIADRNTKVDVTLLDISGRPVMKKSYMAYTGVNSLSLDDTDKLAQGVYALRIEANGIIVSKKVIKKD